ncbi:hypothetical protein HMPREF1548_04449 [Clostridium sp. KLE 1755]|nr:hypothetical protein HMPREF1548_04449 [Clostridium sp. KLE 1755]
MWESFLASCCIDLMGFLTGPGGYCIQSLAYIKNTLRISVS